MRLYGYWRSSATWRVRIALELKSLDYEYVPVHLVRDGGEQFSLAHQGRNPLAQVPVLEWEGAFISQSLAIMELLEEIAPQRPILPSGVRQRAIVRQYAEMVNAGTQPLQNLSTLRAIEALGGDKATWGREFIGRGLGALEALAVETAGDFLVGDVPTMADACLVPQMYNARRFGLDLSVWPTLARVDANCAAHPAFIAAHADNQIDAA